MALTLVVVVIITALIFDFTNGFHDSANAMATSVATGAFKPRVAVLVAAVFNFVGASMSVEVAKTISGGIVDDQLIAAAGGVSIVFAGLVGAILWNLLTWLFGLPSSSSHAMFGGLIGAVLASAGWAGIHPGVIISKILLPALVAPLVAGVAAGFATRLAYRITDHTAHHASKTFLMGQRVSASMVALAHGTSDGQKTMGLITLVLVVSGFQTAQPGGTRPQEWVIVAAAMAIALGTYSGGWRIMRTMGKGLVEIESPQGFAAETAATATILASSHLGFGLSTTHVCSGAILGSGVGRQTKVNWGIASRMMSAWLLTLPAAGLVGAGACLVTKQGPWGFFVMLGVLIAACLVIVRVSHIHKVDHTNVTDSGKVKVLPGKKVRGSKRRISFVKIPKAVKLADDTAVPSLAAPSPAPSPSPAPAPSPAPVLVSADTIAGSRPAVKVVPRRKRSRRSLMADEGKAVTA